MTDRLQGTDHSACPHVGARPLRWSAVVVSRGLRAGAMDSTCHTRSTHAVPAAACAILGASLLAVGAVLMKPVESSGISARIDGANGSIDPHQESNMKTSQAFRTAGALGVLAVTQIALVSGASAQASAVQWRVEDGGNGHWYAVGLEPELLTWSQAQSTCNARGASLASLGTQAESDWIFETLVNDVGFWRYSGPYIVGPWIGGRGRLGNWRWDDGSLWNFAAWLAGEGPPSPDPNEQFAHYFAGTGALTPRNAWGDYFDVLVTQSFVLEWFADCNSDGIVDFGQCLDGSLPDANANNIPDCCEQGIPCSPCYAFDLNPTGIVDGADLGALLAFWGPVSPAFPRADINRDGFVNGADLGILLANWGPCEQ